MQNHRNILVATGGLDGPDPRLWPASMVAGSSCPGCPAEAAVVDLFEGEMV